MKLEWIPLHRVGPFMFGRSINEYRVQYDLHPVPEEYNEKVAWDVYALSADNEIRIYCEKGVISSVSCENWCIYQGENIISLSLDEVFARFGEQPDAVEIIELSEGPQDVYDFDELGLQLWLKHGKVVAALCSGPCDDND